MNLIQRVGARLLGLRQVERVQAVQVWGYREGDTVVVQVAGRMPRSGLEHIRAEVGRELRGARVLVFDAGLRIGGVLRREDAPPAGEADTTARYSA